MVLPPPRKAGYFRAAGRGEGWGPVAPPVFKTELRGVSRADGSTPSLLRHFPSSTGRRGTAGLRDEVGSVFYSPHVEQEDAVVNAAQDRRVGLPEPPGDLFRGQAGVPHRNHDAG